MLWSFEIRLALIRLIAAKRRKGNRLAFPQRSLGGSQAMPCRQDMASAGKVKTASDPVTRGVRREAGNLAIREEIE